MTVELNAPVVWDDAPPVMPPVEVMRPVTPKVVDTVAAPVTVNAPVATVDDRVVAPVTPSVPPTVSGPTMATASVALIKVKPLSPPSTPLSLNCTCVFDPPGVTGVATVIMSVVVESAMPMFFTNVPAVVLMPPGVPLK